MRCVVRRLVLDTTEFLLRKAVERLVLDTAESLEARRMVKLRVARLLLTQDKSEAITERMGTVRGMRGPRGISQLSESSGAASASAFWLRGSRPGTQAWYRRLVPFFTSLRCALQPFELKTLP